VLWILDNGMYCIVHLLNKTTYKLTDVTIQNAQKFSQKQTETKKTIKCKV
jgi:hypothetical protein